MRVLFCVKIRDNAGLAINFWNAVSSMRCVCLVGNQFWNLERNHSLVKVSSMRTFKFQNHHFSLSGWLSLSPPFMPTDKRKHKHARTAKHRAAHSAAHSKTQQQQNKASKAKATVQLPTIINLIRSADSQQQQERAREETTASL